MQSCVSMVNEDELPIGLDLVSNAADDVVIRNCEANDKLDHLPRFHMAPAHDRPVCIVGGGPSVRAHVDVLRARQKNDQDIWALNGAYGWLLENDIEPDAAWLVDSLPQNAGFYVRPWQWATHYIAARCDPSVFKALDGLPVILWWDQSCQQLAPKDAVIIGGGTTVGMKALCGAYALGYRRVHLYGFDSSYADGHHVYSQSWNDDETVYDVTVAGRTFKASGWMLGQVKNFGAVAPALAEKGCEITVHGDGLLPWVARDMARQMDVAA